MSRLASLFLGKDPPDSEEPPEDTRPYAILFVDDEAGVLSAMKRIFRKETYRIFTASCGEEALECLRREEIHVIITDHRMPGITGADLLRRIKREYPNTIRIMLTGHADVGAIMGAVNEGAVYKFITKPWSDEDLRITVGLALEQYDLIRENRALKKNQVSQTKRINQMSRFINTHRSQVGSILMKQNLLRKNDLENAREIQAKKNLPMPQVLMEMGLVDEGTILNAIQREMGINRVYPAEFSTPEALVALIPREICKNNLLVPLKRTETGIMIAMNDPSEYLKIEDLQFITGLRVEPVIATRKEIIKKIEELYGEEEAGLDELTVLEMEDPTEAIEIILDEEDEEADLKELLIAKDQPPAIRIVNAIISDALRHEASDVHIEPKTKYVMVRYRMDGLLNDKIHVPITMHPAIVSRIKVMAELDISERRRPQDGRITVKTPSKMVDIRLSCLPTINGEKVVFRILDRNASIKSVEDLGLTNEEKEMVTRLINRPQGCILTTGPTGSGKTSTLYSLMQENASVTKNYTTIEDPVEYFMSMAEQVMVKEKIGLNFPIILRAILRQDPNVIMLGEIRDFETAEVAFHAALTGHTVLSTLHTNGSIPTITRLRDMGIQPYVIGEALSGIIAQRLVRRICDNCKEEEALSPATVDALGINANGGTFPAFHGKGCDRCNNSGYRGRTGLFEILTVTQEIKQLINTAASESELTRAARWAGMKPLVEDGWTKINQGVTTAEEVLRVLGPQNTLEVKCPHCNANLRERHRYCPFCSGRILLQCINCGCYLEPDWNGCPDCATRVTDR
ncbi:ATPase, T2SS/T4P/T4SS family [Desulfoluna butyratoxydans]|uniref:Type ii secretion system protein e n=1 Tax=Desulfoluna butyratoxydans TaxID=231438 RepID=A0A4U8YPF1_9BACT|nr:ATPase, T2SS/T4P/T4SS family [Desulfoluna butyratoxydans]VFQ43552.1 type ii secretion system protein e [Desulfoluna butyratoxydans]